MICYSLEKEQQSRIQRAAIDETGLNTDLERVIMSVVAKPVVVMVKLLELFRAAAIHLIGGLVRALALLATLFEYLLHKTILLNATFIDINTTY